MRRSTVTAEGESNTFGTACTSTVGLKLSLSQPSGPIGWSELSWLTKLALSNVDGFCHELARTVVVSGPVRTEASSRTVAVRTLKPNRAGTPGGVSRLYTAANRSPKIDVCSTLTPTADSSGHAPELSDMNVAIGHFGVALGSPTSPGGRSTWTSL